MRVSNLNEIADVLMDAVLAGGREVLAARLAGDVEARYKDAKELVTVADRRSDAAILEVFQTRLWAIDAAISFHLEESGVTGKPGAKVAGADPLDGTNHFAAGGVSYSVMAHYVEDGVPLVGVVFQPEVFLPLAETERCIGRLVWAIAAKARSLAVASFGQTRLFFRNRAGSSSETFHRSGLMWLACRLGSKMDDEGRERAERVHASAS